MITRMRTMPLSYASPCLQGLGVSLSRNLKWGPALSAVSVTGEGIGRVIGVVAGSLGCLVMELVKSSAPSDFSYLCFHCQLVGQFQHLLKREESNQIKVAKFSNSAVSSS